MSQELSFGDMSVGQLYTDLIGKGIDKSDAAVLASSWIFENIAGAARTFRYVQPFPASDPACAVPPFTRTFEHRDWFDGQSVVQAQETPDEAGFNTRFHQIETDLDRLGGDVATVVTCLASMRASLRQLLDEIRAELNRLNADVHAGRPKGPVGPVKPPYYDVVDATTYKGRHKWLGKDVNVFETPAGTLVLPVVETIGSDILTGGRLRGGAMITRYVTEHDEIRQRFPQEIEVKALEEEFGDVVLTDGRRLGDVIKVLPAEAKFAGLDALIAEVSEREAAIVRTTAGAAGALSTALGMEEAQLGSVAAVDVGRLTTLPAKARAALAEGGVGTLKELASATPQKLVEVLAAKGVQASLGQAAEWAGFARTLTLLR